MGAPAVADRAGREVPASGTGAVRIRPPACARHAGYLARRAATHLLVVFFYALPAVALWWHAWDGHLASRLACECGDPGQALWFVAWPAYALAHGVDPFFSHALQAPYGVNIVANASSVPVGVALAPLTLAAGPVVSTNVALTLCPALSAWACWVAARELVGSAPAALLAGGLFGYSPFAVSNLSLGHLGLALLVAPPLLLVVARRVLFAGSERRPWWGAAAGALVVLQFLVSSEILAIVATVGLPCLVLALLVGRRRLAPATEILAAVAAGAATAVLLLAAPMWLFLAGPQHLSGPLWPASSVQADVLSALWDPGRYRAPASALLRFGGDEGLQGPPSGYLGPVVLAAAAISLALAWRRRTAWLLVSGAGLAALFSLGSILRITPEHWSSVWLPWRLVTGWPLLDDVIPQRFSAVTDLCVALLVGVGFDRAAHVWRARRRRTSPTQRARTRTRSLLGAAAAGAACLAVVASVWWTYQVPLAARAVSIPLWYATAARRLPPGSVVLSYPFPFPSDGAAAPMVWQALDDMDFTLAGGYVKVPGRDHRPLSLQPVPLADDVLARLTSRASGPLPGGTSRELESVRRAIERWGVDRIVVTTRGRDPAAAVAFFTAVTGTAPRRADGARVWTLRRR